ncbi:MAG: hypothetical protein ACPLRW_07360 [Moorellales bacterium]
MKPRALLAAGLLAACLVAGFGVWRYAAGLAPRQTAAEYVAALARGDSKTARGYSAGSAAFAATKLEGVEAKAQVQRVRSFLSALGRGWAVVNLETELVLADGTADVGWYEAELVRDGAGWKVLALQEVPPFLSGVSLPVWSGCVEAATTVFREYLSLLSRGEYVEAARLCVGPARAAQERQAPALGKAPVLKDVGEVSARPLWRRGGYIAILASYRADGRPVKIAVLMYRTVQGWRIVRVDQA